MAATRPGHDKKQTSALAGLEHDLDAPVFLPAFGIVTPVGRRIGRADRAANQG
jgi:hypothetical protein